MNTIDQWRRDGLAAFELGDYRTAKQFLENVVKETPSDVEIWLLLADLSQKEIDYRYYLKTILSINPDHIEAKERWTNLSKEGFKPRIVIADVPRENITIKDNDKDEYGITAQPEQAKTNLVPPQTPVPIIVSQVSGMLVCQKCGLANIPERSKCKTCGTELSRFTSTPAISTTPLSLEERKAVLDRAVAQQVSAGYILLSRTDTTAQMVRETPPNGCLMVGLFLLGIIPGLIYMVIAKRTDSIYMEVDEYGRLHQSAMSR